MQTPLECAYGLANFFQEKLAEYCERNEAAENFNVYVGYLPLATRNEEKKTLCPAVVIRPLEVNDGENESSVIMGVYVTTYDNDKKFGCLGLYHVIEFLRFQLLINNPVNDKWRIIPGTLSTSIPDEQPWPQWWARLDFAINIMQPKRVINEIFDTKRVD